MTSPILYNERGGGRLMTPAMNRKAYSTLAEAVQDLKARGYSENFEFLNNAFRALNTGRTFRAEELTIREHHRFEGESDPDDQSVVYAIETRDGTRGVLTDAYGVYASPELGEFLKDVKIREEL
jgi:hypothetical protein